MEELEGDKRTIPATRQCVGRLTDRPSEVVELVSTETTSTNVLTKYGYGVRVNKVFKLKVKYTQV